MPNSSVHQQTGQFFDRTAGDYVNRSSGSVCSFSSLIFQRRISIVESFLKKTVKPGAKVLDYGMGPAVFARSCTSLGAHYLGIDLSAEMVERSKNLALPNAEFEVGDLEALTEYKQQKDVVLAIGLIDYLDDVPAGIARLAECVKEDGHLIVSFRNRYALPSALRDAAKLVLKALVKPDSKRAFFAPVHEKSFDFAKHMAPQLARLGFVDVQVEYFNCSPMFFNFWLPRTLWRAWYQLDGWIAHPITRFLCSGAVLRATKNKT